MDRGLFHECPRRPRYGNGKGKGKACVCTYMRALRYIKCTEVGWLASISPSTLSAWLMASVWSPTTLYLQIKERNISVFTIIIAESGFEACFGWGPPAPNHRCMCFGWDPPAPPGAKHISNPDAAPFSTQRRAQGTRYDWPMILTPCPYDPITKSEGTRYDWRYSILRVR